MSLPPAAADPYRMLARTARRRANELSLLYAITGSDTVFAALQDARDRCDQLDQIAADPGRWN